MIARNMTTFLSLFLLAIIWPNCSANMDIEKRFEKVLAELKETNAIQKLLRSEIAILKTQTG
jgi:hypothetical protein